MDPVLKKLSLKTQNPVLIYSAPAEFKSVQDCITAEVHTSIRQKYDFIISFASVYSAAQKASEELSLALNDGGVFWFCYPKGTSKKYKSDINRNTSWELFSPYGLEPVSQVAIDDDWSALRFKKIDEIKTLTRKTASTEKGKERIGKGK